MQSSFVAALRPIGPAASTSSESRSGKYHSAASTGERPNSFATFSIGVTSPFFHGRGSPLVASAPARTWISDSTAGEVDSSNA